MARNIPGGIRINHDYFALTGRRQNIGYFLRQGHLLVHLIDRIKWHYFPRYFITPDFPTHLDIEVSSLCQMRCPMCKTTEMTKKGLDFAGIMDLKLYKKIIDECSSEPVYSIKLSWRGEPLLNPDIVKMVRYAKERGIKDVAFLSNGERLSPDLIEELIRAGLDWISISFDGMGEIYDEVRAPAKFKETVEKIKNIRLLREKSGKKKPLIRVQSVHSAIIGKEEEFLRLWDGIADRVNFIADQKRSLDESDYKHDPGYVCPSPWQRACISWNGNVAQCYGDYLEGNVLGNVANKSIRQIWHGERFRQLRALMKSARRLDTKPCRTCSDGGLTEAKIVNAGNRRIRALQYVYQQVDVKALVGKKSEK